ncbi:MAG: type II toxin-antitoxin system toxin DNA ADP-ribosyl transferase DarT [Betaproteobacteria bacterium]
MPVPAQPKIYHIVHVNRLPSIVADESLWSDFEAARRASPGTTIGMTSIKQRRLTELTLSSHPGLHVGQCVPFYFCPRSVMLYLMYQGNHPELTYRGGQGPIVHLEANLRAVVAWANQNRRRWAFTLSNAGSRFFEDRSDLARLNEVDWNAVEARDWRQCKEGKQAEFLVETSFPWHLVERIGVYSRAIHQQAANALPANGHRPPVDVLPNWYY